MPHRYCAIAATWGIDENNYIFVLRPVRVFIALNFAMPTQTREGDGIHYSNNPMAGRAISANWSIMVNIHLCICRFDSCLLRIINQHIINNEQKTDIHQMYQCRYPYLLYGRAQRQERATVYLHIRDTHQPQPRHEREAAHIRTLGRHSQVLRCVCRSCKTHNG